MTVSYPRRGEIYWVKWLGGAEPYQETRPSLIVQNDVGNRVANDVIVVPITKTVKNLPFMVKVPVREGGLNYESCVDCAAIFTIPKDRLGDKIGQLPAARMNEVDRALCISLGIPLP